MRLVSIVDIEMGCRVIARDVKQRVIGNIRRSIKSRKLRMIESVEQWKQMTSEIGGINGGENYMR